MDQPEAPGLPPTQPFGDVAATIDVGGARVASAGVAIGRYQLLALAGVGGMGMVWSAWDPELERRVALKLVRPTERASRERMLREGQVLARLSHPNVIPIFDVGTFDDQVYLVMEWIKGDTLAEVARAALGARAILAVYRQAAVGLAAAHAAGIVHRDFKPANAIRGDDGRVRVLDFGLAHTADDRERSGGGTPRYMAPEQERGETATPASDQFALCRSLLEALDASGPVPKWIAAVLDRGCALAAADRYPTMDAVIAALDRDPARLRRRRIIAAAALTATVAAFAVGWSIASGSGATPCSGGAAEVATSWDHARRDQIVARIGGLGRLGAAEATRLGTDLDGYATAWVGQHRAACLANERGELTPNAYELRLGCLSRARAQLGAVGEVLAGVDADGLGSALVAARSLPDIAACGEIVGGVDPPPAAMRDRVRDVGARVERALVRAVAGTPAALGEATAATTDARATGYRPLIARALLVEGRAALVAEDGHAADDLDEAWRVALAAGDDPGAVEAYARWLYAMLIANEHGYDAAWPAFDVIGERAGARGRFARALLYNNVALGPLVDGNAKRARELYERATTIAGPEPEIELLAIVQNLALLESDVKAAERLRRQAFDRSRAVLGPDHPDTAVAQMRTAVVVRDRAAARTELEAACTALAPWQRHELSVECAYEAGWLADELGDRVAAIAWMQQAAGGAPTVDTSRTAVAAAYVAIATNAADKPARLAAVIAVAAPPEGLPKDAVERARAADAQVVLALAAHGDGRAVDAEHAWQEALATFDTIELSPYQRRRAHVASVLAELWAQRRPAEAAELARAALPWYGATADAAIANRLRQIAGP